VTIAAQAPIVASEGDTILERDMRAILLAAVLAASATAATAQPVAKVSVHLGVEMQAKARTYGQRELDALAIELQQDVQRALQRSRQLSPQGGELTLELSDAKPNRPTFQQLGDNPGLSASSFGIGGAEIRGMLTNADGSTREVRFHWYETDIRQAFYRSVWGDAQSAFSLFADDVAHGRYSQR
jgi:hypothetical protein